ncbi:hypothetical protein DAMA08_039680 [Martiniozyma asiatica (nom. inval.)]|nr:hypothetical protein DAMA08_039680 [Martiniozyma asiatica]
MNLFQRPLYGHYKRQGPFKFYLIAFIISVFACLALGILTLFSIFAEPLHKVLGYNQSIINNVIIFQVLGINIFTPLSGYIADAKGIWILSCIAFFGYFIGFNLILAVVRFGLGRHYIYTSFFILGCSHASFLFSCLLNSAKSLGRYYRTLSISAPNMMVSFSSFIEIQILHKYFNKENAISERDNFENILMFFLYLLLFACILSFVSCKLTDTTEYFEFEYDETSTSIHEEFLNFETSPLLTGAGTVIHSGQTSIIGSPRSWYVDDTLNLDDELSMLSSSTNLNNSRLLLTPYRQKVNSFIFDPYMYPLLFCCLISIGATEFFIANLSSILGNLNLSKYLDENLQLFSISSTITRFTIMIFTDLFCTSFQISRLTLFTLVVILCGVVHIYLSSTPIVNIDFQIVIVIVSILNSAVFTLFPAILASIYGIEILGTTWGVCSSSSVFGNMFLNLMYSMDFGKNCVSNMSSNLVICSTLTFFASGVMLLFFGFAVFWLRATYLRRAGEFF